MQVPSLAVSAASSTVSSTSPSPSFSLSLSPLTFPEEEDMDLDGEGEGAEVPSGSRNHGDGEYGKLPDFPITPREQSEYARVDIATTPRRGETDENSNAMAPSSAKVATPSPRTPTAGSPRVAALGGGDSARPRAPSFRGLGGVRAQGQGMVLTPRSSALRPSVRGLGALLSADDLESLDEDLDTLEKSIDPSLPAWKQARLRAELADKRKKREELVARRAKMEAIVKKTPRTPKGAE